MKVITVNGRDYKISDRDLKHMLQMFDTDKAALSFNGYYSISVRSVCADHSRKCIHCSFYDPGKKVNSCMQMFRKILGEQDFRYIYFLDQGIFWDSAFDKQARQALKKMRYLLGETMEVD